MTEEESRLRGFEVGGKETVKGEVNLLHFSEGCEATQMIEETRGETKL